MSDPGDEDFEDSREMSGSDIDAVNDSGSASESPERPQRLKLTFKPRAAPSTPRGRGTGRPRGRPRGSGSGLTLKVRRKQPDVIMDEADTPPAAATPSSEPAGECSECLLHLCPTDMNHSNVCWWQGICQSGRSTIPTGSG